MVEHPYDLQRIPTEVHGFCTELLLFLEERVRSAGADGIAAESPGLGAAGYGVNFRNDVFSMNLYWWGREDAPEARAPNFHHFASNLEVYWQRRIGEAMVANQGITKEDFHVIINDCLHSLPQLRD